MPKPCQTEFAQQRKELLEKSLLNLMETLRYQDISVKEICREANIPRRTFYHYFEDKDDVLDSIIGEITIQCFLDHMIDLRLEQEYIRDSFVRVFRFWRGKNQRKLEVLIKNGLESRLMTHAMQWIEGEKIVALQNSGLPPKLVQIGLMVGITDFFSLLFYWSRNGYQESPEQMAEYAVWVLPQAFCSL